MPGITNYIIYIYIIYQLLRESMIPISAPLAAKSMGLCWFRSSEAPHRCQVLNMSGHIGISYWVSTGYQYCPISWISSHITQYHPIIFHVIQYSKIFKDIQRYSKIFKDIQRYSKIFKDIQRFNYYQILSIIIKYIALNGVPLGLTGGEWSLAARAVEENVLPVDSDEGLALIFGAISISG